MSNSISEYRKSLREEAIANGTYDENLRNGAEFLYPGRRNFFSPVTSYKAVKSKFYCEGDKRFNAENVPLQKWEVDVLAHHAGMDGDFIWNSVGSRDFGDDEVDMFDLHDTEYVDTYTEEVDYSSPLECWWSEDSDELSELEIAELCGNSAYIAASTEENIYSPDLLEEVVRIENKLGIEILNKEPELDLVAYNKIKLIIKKLEGEDAYDTPKSILKSNIKFIKENRKKIGSLEEVIEYNEKQCTDFLLRNIHSQLAAFINVVEDYVEKGLEWNEDNWFHLEKSFFFFLRLDFRIKGDQKVCLIPSGGGKTNLFRRYYKYVMDIDYLLHLYGDYSYFYFLIEYSKVFNRWHVVNGFWKFILYKYHALYEGKILLAHSMHQIPHFDRIICVGMVPNKPDDYDKRAWRSNLDSIRQEVNIINCPQKSLFYMLYKVFIVKDSYNDKLKCYTFH